MNEILKEFLDTKKAEEKKKYEEEKQKTLIELGIYEKEYSPDNSSHNGKFPHFEWDNTTQTAKYYKIIPIKITDEEYEDVKKYIVLSNNQNSNNSIANILKILAVIIYIVGFIFPFCLEAEFPIMLIYWLSFFILGTIYLGFAEIIQLLTDIKNK